MVKHALSLVAAATLVVSLEAEPLTLEPLTITSNAITTDELRAPYATEIYTSKEIEASHAINIYDFFTLQNSLIVSPSYNNPFSQQLDLHGYGIGDAGYQNLVVTLNGRRLNNIDMAPQLLGSIPISTIERIEILKGAGSVVYGDGANAAVINIITKEGNQNQLTLMGGNYHTHGESLYLSSAKETFSYAFHLDHFDTNGIRTIDSKRTTDSQKSTNGGIALTYWPNTATEIYGSLNFTRNNSLYGGTLTLQEYNDNPTQQGTSDKGFGFSPSDSTNQLYRSQIATLGFKHILSNEYSFDIAASQEIKRSDFIINPTSASPYTLSSDYRYQQLNATLNYDTDHFSGALGAQGTYGNVDYSRNQISKDNGAVFFTGEYQMDRHLISLGGRYEKAFYHYQDVTVDTKTDDALYAYEAGYSYFLNTQESLFTHYAHAFQFADVNRIMLFDSTWPYTDPVTFNGFINPMQTDTYTFGYTHIDDRSKLKASFYYIDLRDELYYYTNDLSWIATVTSNTNIDKSHKYGFDLSYLRSLNEQWNITLGYNYVKAIIDDEKIDGKDFSGNELPGVSNHSAQTTLTYLPNTHTSVSISQVYRSKAYAQLDFGNDFKQKQDAYSSTNIGVNYTKDNYELFAKINNLFDQSNGIWIRDDQIYPANFQRTVTAGLKFIF